MTVTIDLLSFTFGLVSGFVLMFLIGAVFLCRRLLEEQCAVQEEQELAEALMTAPLSMN